MPIPKMNYTLNGRVGPVSLEARIDCPKWISFCSKNTFTHTANNRKYAFGNGHRNIHKHISDGFSHFQMIFRDIRAAKCAAKWQCVWQCQKTKCCHFTHFQAIHFVRHFSRQSLSFSTNRVSTHFQNPLVKFYDLPLIITCAFISFTWPFCRFVSIRTSYTWIHYEWDWCAKSSARLNNCVSSPASSTFHMHGIINE